MPIGFLFLSVMHRFKIALLIFLLINAILVSGAWAETPKIVVTLKPIHSIVASLTQGVSQVDLLLPDGASPHTFGLKPSHLRQLQQADLIIWVGPELELFMDKAITQMHPSWGIITLLTIPDLNLLPIRSGRTWQSHHDHHHAHDHHEHHHSMDPHFWLSIYNTQKMVNYLAHYLIEHDPEHTQQYQMNAQELQNRLQRLAATLQQELQQVQHQPFLVYHDGYQYFEKEFHLHAAGTLVLNPHLPLSAQGLRAVQKLIKEENIHCVFRETEFQDTTIIKALGSLPIQVAELDPLGVRQPLGPDHYELTMLALGKTFKTCLLTPLTSQPKI